MITDLKTTGVLRVSKIGVGIKRALILFPKCLKGLAERRVGRQSTLVVRTDALIIELS